MVNVLFDNHREHVSLGVFIQLNIGLQEKDDCPILAPCGDVDFASVQEVQAIDFKLTLGSRLRHQDASRVEIVYLHNTGLVTDGDDLLLTTLSYRRFGLHYRNSLNRPLDGSLVLTAQSHFVLEDICLAEDPCGVTRLHYYGLNTFSLFGIF